MFVLVILGNFTEIICGDAFIYKYFEIFGCKLYAISIRKLNFIEFFHFMCGRVGRVKLLPLVMLPFFPTIFKMHLFIYLFI